MKQPAQKKTASRGAKALLLGAVMAAAELLTGCAHGGGYRGPRSAEETCYDAVNDVEYLCPQFAGRPEDDRPRTRLVVVAPVPPPPPAWCLDPGYGYYPCSAAFHYYGGRRLYGPAPLHFHLGATFGTHSRHPHHHWHGGHGAHGGHGVHGGHGPVRQPRIRVPARPRVRTR